MPEAWIGIPNTTLIQGWWQQVGGSEVQDKPQPHREFKARVNVVFMFIIPVLVGRSKFVEVNLGLTLCQ